jgi:hypothetical protein
VADQGLRAGGENGRHPFPELIDFRSAYREHTAMKSMQAPFPHTVVDRVCGETKISQLSPRHHSVLPVRQLPQPSTPSVKG